MTRPPRSGEKDAAQFAPRQRHAGDHRGAAKPYAPRCEAEGCGAYYAFGFEKEGRTRRFCPAHRHLGQSWMKGGDAVNAAPAPAAPKQGEKL